MDSIAICHKLITQYMNLLHLNNNSDIIGENTKNTYHEFLNHVLSWNPEWLSDEKYDENFPDVINDITIIPTQQQYKNVEEYQNVMFPMLIHEFWHVLKQDFAELMKQKRNLRMTEIKSSEPSSGVMVTGTKNDQIYSFIVIAETSSKHFPRYGDLTILKGSDTTQSITVFAYVNLLKEHILKTNDETENKDEKKLLTYELLTNISFRNNMISEFSLTTVSFLLQHLSLADTLNFLPQFVLLPSILRPTAYSYSLSTRIEHLDPSFIITKDNLNLMQKKVVMGVLGNIEITQPKICFVQGPPGTGKSKTIVNLVGTILKSLGRRKILLCAPSNKAVDSLLLQLLEAKSTFDENGLTIHIVRIGNEDKIDDSVKEYSLVNQALRQKENRRISLFCIKQEILKQADVIVGTLTSCYTNRSVTSVFGLCPFSRLSIPLCIIDEAAQATELLTLVPLMLGVQQLILVGDPQQLPPLVLSEAAKNHGYGASLFSRAEKIFATEGINPIITLNTQYRMTESISQWPNEYFYKGVLKNSATIHPLGICQYKLFNHQFPQGPDGYTNVEEAELVIEMTKLMKTNSQQINDNISIAIITPYRKQCELISKKLESTKMKENIEVNTVDSFQGSEKDIIIMSCVRSFGLGFTHCPNRLCVSLTRAKHTLIIVGNFNTFLGNKMWKSLINDAKNRGVYINITDKTAKSLLKKNIIADNLKEESSTVSNN
ncbi:probable helicase MAGATAMA 3 [Chelonus insularis]|uniref:probable helicase MAGATAMA 3 n=1 Tax=Chelonus insularis TaxID=460826 RepID=UPI001589CC09|nr:probable helicase MAGATAMA 3 [Chelonus insularis]